ncbi:NAD-dependent epimerase/dehydratase family protein [uncultured Paraglaciecola sp.]|uniref:NAD-dependent epimerase/dehydratase family protein n=1 Tax=uncultured Paraglaciecola sp. TaxID=1765024 RepID=UPI0030D89FF3
MKQKLGNVLITGGAGFVGSNLTRFLVKNNLADKISILDNESVGSRTAVSDFDVEFILGDLRDKNVVMQALKGIDVVIHLAADTRVIDSIKNPRFNFENNVVATFELMMSMVESGVSKLINASTGGAILGEVPPPVHELMVPNPLSPYGASKLAIEGYSSAFAEIYNMNIMNLRFSNVYGPLSFHKGSVVATYLKALLNHSPIVVFGDGEQTRDYIYTEDLCKGIVQAIQSDLSGVFQLGTGVATSINQLINNMKAVIGDQLAINVEYKEARLGEIIHTHCDISKARQAFGFNPSTQVREGIGYTWEWFQG